MKIAVISNFYPPFAIGGYERLCHEVSCELALRGHEIVVLTSTFGAQNIEALEPGVSRSLRLIANEADIYAPVSLDAAQRNALVQHNASSLRAFLTRTQPDVIFAWNLYFLGPEFVTGLMAQEIPVVAFLTDNWLIAAANPVAIGEFFQRFVHGPETYQPGAELPIDQRRTSKHAAIYGSRFMQNLHRSAGFSFEHEEVIHHGVQLPIVSADMRIDRSRKVSDGRLKLLFAGRVVDVKGPHVLLAAMPRIQQALAPLEVTLNLVGDRQDGRFVAQLQEQIREFGLEKQVTFSDPVAPEELLSLFNDHDIFVFPSLYEPFALTLIHALGAGIPTVTSDAGGNVEIVTHEVNGLIHERLSPDGLAEAVIRLASDDGLRQHLSAAAIRIAYRFPFRRMIERIERELMLQTAPPIAQPA